MWEPEEIWHQIIIKFHTSPKIVTALPCEFEKVDFNN